MFVLFCVYDIFNVYDLFFSYMAFSYLEVSLLAKRPAFRNYIKTFYLVLCLSLELSKEAVKLCYSLCNMAFYILFVGRLKVAS